VHEKRLSPSLNVFLLGGRGGGGEEVFLRELQAHPPEGVTYFTAMEPHERVPGAKPLRFRAVTFNRLIHPFLWPLQGLRAYDVGPEIDLVHVHNHSTWLRVPAGVPVVFSVGGGSYIHYLEAYLGWTRKEVQERYRLARRVYRSLGIRNEVATPESYDAIVVRSPFAKDQIEALDVPRNKIHAIPPGFEISDPGPPNLGKLPFTFLLVGRDPDRKGADLAVAAARGLRNEGRHLRLQMVGDPSYPSMSEPGLIEGFPTVPRDRLMADHFQKAHAVLVPSRAEGFGFTAVEGMANRKPVIASNVAALPWIVNGGGLLFQSGDIDGLRAAMARLMDNPEEATVLGAQGRQRFEAEFSIDRFRERFGHLYRATLQRHTP